MAVPTAPTSLLGAVETYMPTPWLVDPIEYVPDLMWPVSVYTYAKMRRDPTVKSVLNAYVLPIISAPWHVDPRGASETMTRIVADSLGLPVLGDEVDPGDGPVSTRWVRWGDHLRTALADLVFGFMPFEPVFDVSTGTAYLSGLPERMPWSITEIEVDTTDGQLTAIRQARAGKSDVVIPADRLLWYVHQREGANWAGTSLLREAFGPWLFKQDAMRGQARTLRRFGSAVPVMEPIPGFNPTPAQLQEAARLAQSYRGDGDRAGAVTPGFQLRLVGVQGAMPDHMPFMRYCDEQIARATLTSVLDLGSTNYGSRALGTVFLELMVQALQTVGEDHAVTASQLARKLTDYNEGPDAEAPLIVVGDVASSRQTLATTVATLVQSGALTTDSALENWIRDAFDLPAPTGLPPVPGMTTAAPADGSGGTTTAPSGPHPAGTMPGATGPAAVLPATTPKLAAALARVGRGPHALSVERADRRMRQRHLEELNAAGAEAGDWPYRRQLTTVEAAAGLDPQSIDAKLDALVSRFLAKWPKLAAAQYTDLLNQVRQGVDAADLADLVGYLPPFDDIASALQDAMLSAYDAGVATAQTEAASQGHQLGDPAPPDGDTLTSMATVAAASMATSLTAGTMREAMRLGGVGGSNSGTPATTEAVLSGVSDYLTSLSPNLARDVAAGLVGDGINSGRAAVMATADVPVTYYASEIRDANTCRPCAEIDGHQFDDLQSAELAYPTGGYIDCDGGMRCRGVIVARYQDLTDDSSVGDET